MFSRLDPLVSFDCPRCAASLRFRRVDEAPASGAWLGFLRVCPACGGTILLRHHAAFADDWRWMRFVMPGVLAAALGTFAPGFGWLVPVALALLAAGLVAVVAYMLWQRWNWRTYVLPPESPGADAGDGVDAPAVEGSTRRGPY